MKKRLILILNGKGGVGKSFFAVNFVQYLKDRQIAHIAFDSDDENSTLKRFHSEAGFFDVNKPREIDNMIRALEKHNIVVVDCRAASTRIFLNYFEQVNLIEILENHLNARLTIVCPVNYELDSIYQIQKLATAIGNGADFVIVRNEVHGEGFELFDKSKVRQKLLSGLGAKEIVVHKMEKWLVESLQKSRLTVTTAKVRKDFSVIGRQRLGIWQREFYEQLDSVGETLMPANIREIKADASAATNARCAAAPRALVADGK